jgi:transposase-like protein
MMIPVRPIWSTANTVELTEDNKIKRTYIRFIKDYFSKSLIPLFEKHIAKDAKVTTDGWRGYNPIAKNYDIQQIPSNKGRNFKELHTVIGQIK